MYTFMIRSYQNLFRVYSLVLMERFCGSELWKCTQYRNSKLLNFRAIVHPQEAINFERIHLGGSLNFAKMCHISWSSLHISKVETFQVCASIRFANVEENIEGDADLILWLYHYFTSVRIARHVIISTKTFISRFSLYKLILIHLNMNLRGLRNQTYIKVLLGVRLTRTSL